MKKNDWILIAAVFVAAGIFFGMHLLTPGVKGGVAEVTIDGVLYGTYALDENQTVTIRDTNRLEIGEGKAKMVWADCPDQICVNQKAISKEGESIICLPNKIVVSIVGGDEKTMDAVTY